MADLDRVKRNISRMIGMNAPEADIDAYIASEGVTLEQVRAHKVGGAPAKAGRSWSDVPGEAIGNIPSSAAKFATDIVQPFLSPVETVKNLADAAAGGLRAGAKAVLPEAAFNAIDSLGSQEANQRIEKTASGVGQFFKDRYGGMEEIKRTLATDPVGAAGDAALALTGGGAIAARAPGAVGRAGQAARTAGQTIDPLNVAGKAASAAVKAPAQVLGLTAGTGARPIEGMFNAGRSGATAAVEHMRGQRPVDEVVGMAERAASAMGRDRNAAYQAGMESTKANKTAIRLGPVVDSIRRARDELTYRVGDKTLVKNPAAMAALDEVDGIVQSVREMDFNAGGRTAEALDALKQAIGGVYETTQQGTQARRVIGGIYNDVKKLIVDTVPEYAKTMRDYEQASAMIKEIRRTLSVNDRAMADTALRKLQSTTRNNVNANFGARTKLVDELAKYEPDLPGALAGQAMSDWMPRGLARLNPQMVMTGSAATFNPLALAMIPTTLPRVIGEASYGLGRGARVADSVGAAVGGDKTLQALLKAYSFGSLMRPITADDQRKQ